MAKELLPVIISFLTKEQLKQRFVEDRICSPTGSLKFEEAADVVHYLVSAWVTSRLEEAMYNGSIAMTDLGLQALAEMKFMLRLSEGMFSRTWCLAYDFRNFNSQHSREDMKRYYSVLREAGVRIDHNWDWMRAIDWLLESVDRTFIRASGNKRFVRAISGLLSGVRATQGINASLNISYMYVINACVTRIIRETLTLDCKSHGDDVHAFVDSWIRGVLMFYSAKEIGYVARDLKVTLEPGKTQYLRIGYDSDCSLNM